MWKIGHAPPNTTTVSPPTVQGEELVKTGVGNQPSSGGAGERIIAITSDLAVLRGGGGFLSFPQCLLFCFGGSRASHDNSEMGFRGDNVTTAPLSGGVGRPGLPCRSVATATRKQKHRPASRRSGGLAVEPRNQTRLGEKCSHASV